MAPLRTLTCWFSARHGAEVVPWSTPGPRARPMGRLAPPRIVLAQAAALTDVRGIPVRAIPFRTSVVNGQRQAILGAVELVGQKDGQPLRGIEDSNS